MDNVLKGEFKKGDRGFICRRPSDGGAWIAPDRSSSTPQVGVEYIIQITGETKNGKLRFAKLIETVSEYNKRLCLKYKDMVGRALNDGAKLVGYYHGYPSRDGGVTMEIDGEDVSFHVNWFHQSKVLVGPEWLPSFYMTKAAESAIALAKKEKEAREEERRRQWQEEDARRKASKDAERLARIEADAPVVSMFLEEHPEARKWFPSAAITLWDVQQQAVHHKLAKFVRSEKTGHYASFSKEMDFYQDIWELQIGGETLVFSCSAVDQISGED